MSFYSCSSSESDQDLLGVKIRVRVMLIVENHTVSCNQSVVYLCPTVMLDSLSLHPYPFLQNLNSEKVPIGERLSQLIPLMRVLCVTECFQYNKVS
jgi:hypothetical protein